MIRPLIEHHIEDAAFLWLLRSVACRAPHYRLDELAKLDRRLESQFEALRMDPELSLRLCWKADATEDAGKVFLVTVLAMEHEKKEDLQRALEVGATSPDLSCGLVSAFGWLPYERVGAEIKRLLESEAAQVRRIGIAASAIHRRQQSPALLEALDADDPWLRARALRAAGEHGFIDSHIKLRSNLRSKAPEVRFWAAWSNTLLNGHKDACNYLQQIAEAGGPLGERASEIAIRRLSTKDAKLWLRRLVKDLEQTRIAVIAAGAFADPEAIPFLLDQMKVPELARVAGEAFSLITGANIAYEDLEAERPEGFESGPTENPDDENVAMDPDENLPWPDPDLVKKWWNARQGGFSKGTRYLLGQPITTESLRSALKNGYQRQRAAAAIELAILKPGRPLFEVRAPGWRQQAML
ncbi:MAG: TIGR02270 family protein [Isosphaeraceae bacterium]